MKTTSTSPLSPVRWCARLLPLLIALAFSQVSVQAHHLPPGFEEIDEFEHSHAMLVGLQHPLSGWDHCLALAAIGAVAALSVRKKMLLPVMFVAGLVGGGCLGMSGVALPQTPLLAAAVLLLAGAAMYLPKQSLRWAFVASAVALGIWQGASHATLVVLPQTLGAYAAGFVVSSVLLMLAGGLVATLARRLPTRATKLAGAGLALAALVSAAMNLS